MADAWRLYLVLAHSKRPVVSGAFTAWGVPRMGQVMAMFRAGKRGPGAQADGHLHLLPEHAAALGRGPGREHHGLRRVGHPDRDRAGAAARHDLARHHGRRAGAAHGGGAVGAHHRADRAARHAGDLRRRAGVVPHAAHDQPDDRGRGAAALLRLRAGREAAEAAAARRTWRSPTPSSTTRRPGWRRAWARSSPRAPGSTPSPAPGMLDYVNCFSFEKLVFDDEVVAHAQRFVRPVEVREDLPAAELIAELVRDKPPAHLGAHARPLAGRALPAGADGRPHQLGPVERAGLARLARPRQRGHRRDAGGYEVEPLRRSASTPRSRRLIRKTCSDPGTTLPALTESSRMADYALMNQLLFEGKHEPVADDRGGARRGRPAMEVLEDGPHRRHARGGRGLQAQPRVRARGAARRARHEGRHGGAEAAPVSNRSEARAPRP